MSETPNDGRAHESAGSGDTKEEPRQDRPQDASPGEHDRAEETAPPGEECAAKIAELRDRWHRALADLDNYRKRTVRALDDERAAERARTCTAWLPVIDDLERALQHAGAEPNAVIQGVRSVFEQAQETIARLGFPRQDDEGKPFDPIHHEAVSTVPADDVPEGTIVQVLRAGYGGPDRQLRPAQVVVAKGRGDGP
jgi:molecular chaperone GrpE